MKMRGRRRRAHHVCSCCNELPVHTRASEKREALREAREWQDATSVAAEERAAQLEAHNVDR